MAAEPMKVIPPALLQAAASAAMITEKAASPPPGAVMAASPGSPADDAVATVAAGMSTRTAQLSTKLASKGPDVQATTQAGVAQLQAQDQQNAAQIKQLADATAAPNGAPHTHSGIQAVDYTVPLRPRPVPPDGRVICTPMMGSAAFGCSEFLPGGRIFHWLSPVDLTGHWPDFPD